ncbi:hypothetical protein FALBO_662 [Fusarium albosuccineum]|uniref:Uncharacterized protein n=1 Tax=Fusarium albosuccineum TaxID=1237068 RepID=A0A8H4LPK1_9HYPO|nr:hypothetical protein FALBO_662 [Fusarium albosuccineum]
MSKFDEIAKKYLVAYNVLMQAVTDDDHVLKGDILKRINGICQEATAFLQGEKEKVVQDRVEQLEAEKAQVVLDKEALGKKEQQHGEEVKKLSALRSQLQSDKAELAKSQQELKEETTQHYKDLQQLRKDQERVTKRESEIVETERKIRVELNEKLQAKEEDLGKQFNKLVQDRDNEAAANKRKLETDAEVAFTSRKQELEEDQAQRLAGLEQREAEWNEKLLSTAEALGRIQPSIELMVRNDRRDRTEKKPFYQTLDALEVKVLDLNEAILEMHGELHRADVLLEPIMNATNVYLGFLSQVEEAEKALQTERKRHQQEVEAKNRMVMAAESALEREKGRHQKANADLDQSKIDHDKMKADLDALHAEMEALRVEPDLGQKRPRTGDNASNFWTKTLTEAASCLKMFSVSRTCAMVPGELVGRLWDIIENDGKYHRLLTFTDGGKPGWRCMDLLVTRGPGIAKPIANKCPQHDECFQVQVIIEEG